METVQTEKKFNPTLMYNANNKRDKAWDKCIKEARVAMKKYKEIRLFITDLAIEACDIHHGGKSESRYTVKRFATEIGLAYGTLYEWIRIKQYVIDKIPKSEQTEDFALYRAVLKKVEHDTPQADVLKAFRNYSKKPRQHIKFEKYIKHLKSIQYNVNRPQILKQIDKKTLKEVSKICSEMSKIINNYLN